MKTLKLLLLITMISTSATAQQSAVFIKDGIAINGYDAVAYFLDNRPVKGLQTFSYQWNKATWQFSSRQHLDSFVLDPEKYVPQFGGYCAFGMAEGHKAPTSANAWTIIDGKLYLNYNKEVQQLWKQKPEEYIQVATKNWPLLKDKE